jgi:hypothetical protein
MNEPATPPTAEPIVNAPEPETVPTSSPAPNNRLALLCGLGFLLLAAAIAYLWSNTIKGEQLVDQTKAFESANQRLAELETRLSRVEERPTPVVSAGDLARLNARLDALDGRLVNQAQVASQIDTMAGRIQALAGRDQSAVDTLNQQVSDLSNKLNATTAATGDLSAVTARVDRLGRLQAAAENLAAGRPLGDLAGAPPALSKYAQKSPPTMAQLRLSFRHAKADALTKPEPTPASTPFVDRVLEKAQGLMTIKQGDNVVVGDATAMLLNQAETLLEAGDLDGAVKSVESMKGDGVTEMAGWLASAKDLLAARGALAQLAAQR